MNSYRTLALADAIAASISIHFNFYGIATFEVLVCVYLCARMVCITIDEHGKRPR